jgi:hypothetical protein
MFELRTAVRRTLDGSQYFDRISPGVESFREKSSPPLTHRKSVADQEYFDELHQFTLPGRTKGVLLAMVDGFNATGEGLRPMASLINRQSDMTVSVFRLAGHEGRGEALSKLQPYHFQEALKAISSILHHHVSTVFWYFVSAGNLPGLVAAHHEPSKFPLIFAQSMPYQFSLKLHTLLKSMDLVEKKVPTAAEFLESRSARWKLGDARELSLIQDPSIATDVTPQIPLSAQLALFRYQRAAQSAIREVVENGKSEILFLHPRKPDDKYTPESIMSRLLRRKVKNVDIAWQEDTIHSMHLTARFKEIANLVSQRIGRLTGKVITKPSLETQKIQTL